MPQFVKSMKTHEVIRTLEICVKRNVGSQRLFDHYILDMIEKHLLKYDVPLYSRMIRAMADKGFVEDYVFWDKFAFKYVEHDPKSGGPRQFTEEEAQNLWNSFVYLKIKCPTLDIKDVLSVLEKFMPKEKFQI